MTKVINPDAIPGIGIDVPSVDTDKVKLSNVLFGDKQTENMEVEVIAFDPYNERHVEFAFGYSDMLFRAPSTFRNVSEASKAYVALFMVHTKEDETDETSKFRKVLGDLRACRTLFHQERITKDLDNFFGNA